MTAIAVPLLTKLPFYSAASGQSAAAEGMRMQLVGQGEGGPQDLPNLMHYWIEKEQCIPGFMASITLESWEKHKSEGIREM